MVLVAAMKDGAAVRKKKKKPLDKAARV